MPFTANLAHWDTALWSSLLQSNVNVVPKWLLLLPWLTQTITLLLTTETLKHTAEVFIFAVY